MTNLMDTTPPASLVPELLPFPNNVIVLLYQELSVIEGVDYVAMRPCRPEDPATSLGIFVMNWEPGEIEMAGRSNPDPTLSTYMFGLHAFVKHGDRQEGLLKHALLSKMVRSMLYRRDSLRVRLSQLNETSLGVLERSQRWGVRQQRFMASELEGSFLYLSTLEFWVETESV